MSAPLDLLAVMAHPDDAEIFCGGSLIKSADAGQRTGVLDLTAGEMGSSGTRESRAAEAAAAAGIMGLAVRRCAGLPDAALCNDLHSRHVVAALIRALRPRVIVTHWTRGRHPDHRAAAELARDASFLSGLRNLPVKGKPHRPEKVVQALSFREDPVKPTFAVDITDQMDRKIEALSAYGTQFQGKSGIGEVFPAGGRPLFAQIRSVHAAYGSLIRRGYAEIFWTEETVEAETLGDLGVGTF